MFTKESVNLRCTLQASVALLFAAALVAHYLLDSWGFYWKVSPEETALRMELVQTAESYLGTLEGDSRHQEILGIYNTHEPLAVGYVVQDTDDWCATFVSAMAIQCGLTDIIPTECGCQRQIGLFQSLGTWEENDAAVPLPGDIIYYDWDARGLGGSTGWADHVGIVVTVIGTIAAIIFPMDDITDFLYLIGSVFAPMIAVQIADIFILRKEKKLTDFDWKNLVIWLIGFVIYRWFMTIDIPVGNTLPDMAVVIVLCLIAELLCGRKGGR